MKYRSDIDGLRALAVLPVIFYHYNLSLFSGGYIGVDIFFVISGYLITSIIHKDLETESFTILNFYERRIRRIFPNLFFLLFVVSVASYILLSPNDLKDYAQSLFASAAFLSNMLFWRESGYFDNIAEYKPLLHTWSLSVEEQFYIVYPVILLILYKFFKNKLNKILVFIFIISILTNILIVFHDQRTAFYFFPLRAWELLIGAAIALKIVKPPQGKLSEWGSFAGLIMILISIFFFSKKTLFPGYNAILPCLGTGLIILCNTDSDNIVKKILSNKILVITGLLSYSLYLWHWPLYVFYSHYSFLFDNQILSIVALLFFSFLLSVFSYRVIEVPFRKKIRLNRKVLFGVTFLIIGVYSAAGLYVSFEKGLPSRFPEYISQIRLDVAKDLTWRKKCYSFKYEDLNLQRLCTLGDNKKRGSYILWGDSHAEALVRGLSDIGKRDGFSGLFVAKSGTSPVFDESFNEPGDGKYNKKVVELIKESEIENVLIAARWSHYISSNKQDNMKFNQLVPVLSIVDPEKTDKFKASFEKVVRELIENGKNVIILAEVPSVGFRIRTIMTNVKIAELIFDSKTLLDKYIRTFDDYMKRNGKVLEIFREIEKKYGAKVIFPHEILCNGGECVTSYKGRPLYKDFTHLSGWGSVYLLNKLIEEKQMYFLNN